MSNTNNRRNETGCVVYKNSVTAPQVFCKSKIILKLNIYFLKQTAKV